MYAQIEKLRDEMEQPSSTGVNVGASSSSARLQSDASCINNIINFDDDDDTNNQTNDTAVAASLNNRLPECLRPLTSIPLTPEQIARTTGASPKIKPPQMRPPANAQPQPVDSIISLLDDDVDVGVDALKPSTSMSAQPAGDELRRSCQSPSRSNQMADEFVRLSVAVDPQQVIDII